MKNIIKSLLVVVAVATIAGTATYSYFSDTETSAGNTFSAGTLDLEIQQSATVPLNLTNMKPGDSAPFIRFFPTNKGTLPGILSFKTDYIEADGVQPAEFPANVSADDFAKMMQVISPIFKIVASGAGVDYAADGDASDLTLYDLKAAGDVVIANPLPANQSKMLPLRLMFDPAAGNDYQADGIAATFTLTLNQVP